MATVEKDEAGNNRQLSHELGQTQYSVGLNENNNTAAENEAKRKHHRDYWECKEWAVKEETHVVTMCSQQITMGV